MALIVEDGTGLTNSESYASVAEANDYWTARNVNNWDGNEANKEGYLRLATEYIDAYYGQRLKGVKSNMLQALQFPRAGVVVDTYEIDSDEVPLDIKKACIELAHIAVHTDLSPNLTQSVIREKIDVLEVEYDKNGQRLPQFTKASSLLAKYLTGVSGQFKVMRS